MTSHNARFSAGRPPAARLHTQTLPSRVSARLRIGASPRTVGATARRASTRPTRVARERSRTRPARSREASSAPAPPGSAFPRRVSWRYEIPTRGGDVARGGRRVHRATRTLGGASVVARFHRRSATRHGTLISREMPPRRPRDRPHGVPRALVSARTSREPARAAQPRRSHGRCRDGQGAPRVSRRRSRRTHR